MAEGKQLQCTTNRFLQASYPDNPPSLSKKSSSSSSLSSKSSPSATLAELNRSNIKKIELKNQDHTIRNLIIVVSIILLIIIGIDINSEIKRQKHKYELQAKHCFNQYMTNQCDNPVQVLKEKCKELHLCYSTEINHNIKIMLILGNIIGRSIKSLISTAGLGGTCILIVLICIFLCFSYKSSKKSITIQRH